MSKSLSNVYAGSRDGIGRIPTYPLLLRSSSPTAEEVALANIAAHARLIPALELAAVLDCSKSTARLRRRGKGWTVGQMCQLARALGVPVSALLTAAVGYRAA